MTTKIVVCACEHKAQDQLHGKGKRVANYAPKSNANTGGYRCTVCGKIHPK